MTFIILTEAVKAFFSAEESHTGLEQSFVFFVLFLRGLAFKVHIISKLTPFTLKRVFLVCCASLICMLFQVIKYL